MHRLEYGPDFNLLEHYGFKVD
jgi:hypothetical protein